MGCIHLIGGGLALGNGLKLAGVIDLIAEGLGFALAGANVYVVVSAQPYHRSEYNLFLQCHRDLYNLCPHSHWPGPSIGFGSGGYWVAVGLSACLAFLPPANTRPVP